MTTHVPSPSQPPVDADAVLRDDVLIDALAKGVLPMEYHDDELTRALLTWRDDIRSAPFEPSVELSADMWQEAVPAEDATQVLNVVYNDFPRHQADVSTASDPEIDEPAAEPSSRFAWIRRPAIVLGTLSVLVLGSLGSVAAASVAEPGSPFWPLAKAVNPDRANSLEAREAARDDISDARAAMREGDASVALEHLEQAQTHADGVRSKDGKSDLEKELADVRRNLDTPTPSPSTPPATPTPPPASPQPTPSPTPSPTPEPSTSNPTPSPSSSPSSTPSPSE